MIKNRRVLIILLILCGIVIVPVMGGTQYLEGSPELTAYISGSNEFSPGTEVELPVIIKNTGINEYRSVQSTFTDADDLPNTAKFLTATLTSGTAPVVIKSDPQMLGDLKGAYETKATFTIRTNIDAPAGTYTLPVILNYSYLFTSDRGYSADTIGYTYKTENITIGIPITIKPEVSIAVLSAEPEHLSAGTEGYLNLKIKNTGSEDGSRAVVKISRNGNSPVTPVENSVFIGDFPSGSTVSSRYKVSVSDTAEKQTYPVDVVVEYQNREGDTVTSRSETVGVPVGGKADFAIISPPAEMHPGNKKVIDVEYKNTGGTPIYSAQARISAVAPFSSSEDIAFIGDLQPGESRIVSYQISAERSATAKEYGLDSEIRYHDALDNTHISDIMKVRVNVTSPTGLTVVVSNPIYLSIIAAVIIGILYLIYHVRSKKQ